MDRYSKNETMLTPEENLSLRSRRILVAGCGGLGGYIAEMLARLGVGNLTLVDNDVFEENNLNRQLFSDSGRLGQAKVEAAEERLGKVNPDVRVRALKLRLDEGNALEICSGHNVLMDGLDNILSRKVLQRAGEELGIPLVHGAIAGWYGQISTIFPGDGTLDRLYSRDENAGVEQVLGNPSFTPAMVASFQVSEALKILIGRGELLRNKLLYLDCLSHEYRIFDI